MPSRPAHDRRYLLNSNKIRKDLLWEPRIDFDSGIISTIDWYVNNHEWWKPLLEKRKVSEKSW